MTAAVEVTRVLQAAAFRGVGTRRSYPLGVIEVWLRCTADQPSVVALAAPKLRREPWNVPVGVLTAGAYLPADGDGIEVAPGPRRVRVLLPTTEGRAALYVMKAELLDALVDIVALAPALIVERRWS